MFDTHMPHFKKRNRYLFKPTKSAYDDRAIRGHDKFSWDESNCILKEGSVPPDLGGRRTKGG